MVADVLAPNKTSGHLQSPCWPFSNCNLRNHLVSLLLTGLCFYTDNAICILKQGPTGLQPTVFFCMFVIQVYLLTLMILHVYHAYTMCLSCMVCPALSNIPSDIDSFTLPYTSLTASIYHYSQPPIDCLTVSLCQAITISIQPSSIWLRQIIHTIICPCPVD